MGRERRAAAGRISGQRIPCGAAGTVGIKLGKIWRKRAGGGVTGAERGRRSEGGEAVDEKPPILLINDDREAVEVTRMALESAFDILSAPTGEFGLSLAFEFKPSVILLDSQLPGMDAFRVCRILRTQEDSRETPILFLSGVTAKEEIAKCFAAGADDFIIKPYSGKDLIEKIWQTLVTQGRRRTVAPQPPIRMSCHILL